MLGVLVDVAQQKRGEAMTFCPIVYPLVPPILLSNDFVLTNYCSRLSVKLAAASLPFVPVHLDPCDIFAPSTGRDSISWNLWRGIAPPLDRPPPCLLRLLQGFCLQPARMCS